MPIPKSCPECAADLRSETIPKENLHLYDGETHFSRVVALYNIEANTTVGWECPDCHHRWPLTEELPGGLRTFEVVMVTAKKPSDS